MKKIKILFLGASKRVTLVERFLDSAKSLGISLEIFSCEKEEDFYPISEYAKILKGPLFSSDEFQLWLDRIIRDKQIDIVIPNMDSATVALSKYKKEHHECKAWLVVSRYDLCEKMNDKCDADMFFNSYDLPIPHNTEDLFPKIAKPKLGFGAKGIVKIENRQQYKTFIENNSLSDYSIQDFINGKETTVDFYISAKKGLAGYVLRDRLEVSDGEVMVCITRMPTKAEKNLIEKISKIAGWEGCITLQYISNGKGIFIIEINPRFGGGATCAIKAGLNMPKYLLSEFLGKEYKFPKKILELKMTRARRDFFYEYKR